MSLPLLAVASLGAMTALTLHRMRRARFTPVTLSTARFFVNEPPSESQRQWVLCPPQWRDRSYLTQMAVLTLLLLAAAFEGLTAPTSDGLRVEICVDVSGSMDTQQDGRRRSEIALDWLQKTLDTIEATADKAGQPADVRLSTFDLDVDQRVKATSDLSILRTLAPIDFQPRLIGTDLAALQRHLNWQSAGDDAWSPTHVVVISDRPAPRWAVESRDRPVQWLDLAAAVDSHGITRLEPASDSLTGRLINVRVHLQAWGTPPTETRVSVTAENRTESAAIRWDKDGYARVNLNEFAVFQSPREQALTLELSGADAWPHDNRAVLDLPDRSQRIVRWQVDDFSPPQLTGWKLENAAEGAQASTGKAPSLVVTDFAGLASVPERVPVLLVGSPPAGRLDAVAQLDPPGNREWFVCSISERQPFLRDVNLDVLEKEAAMRPESVPVLLSALNRSDLRTEDLRVELVAFAGDSLSTGGESRVALAGVNAKGGHGRLVWMPLLPEFGRGASVEGRASGDERRVTGAANSAWQIVFLNAIAWLLDPEDSPLFELTDRSNPQPDYDSAPFRLPLHPGEGDTSHGAKHQATFDPALRITAEQPSQWWQFPLLLALVVLTVERCLAIKSEGEKR